MAKNNGTFKTRIVIPHEIIGKRLFDSDGAEWVIDRYLERKLMLFKRKGIRLANAGTLEKSLKNLLVKECKKELEENFREETASLTQKFTEELAPIFDQCIEQTERDFRKEFVQKLGAQGKSAMREVIEKSFADIGKIWSENKESVSTFTHWGPFPPQTRFWWQLREQKSVYDMFLLEFPPDRRTIKIDNMRRYVAFPWLSVIVVFKNEQMVWFDGNHRAIQCAFWYFYRSSRITSDKDSLHFSNLPHVWNKWPYMCCLGSSLPVIKLTDPDWNGSLLSYFWQSDFTSSSMWLASWVNNQIPEIATAEKWEFLSKTDPDKILALPWPAMDQDIKTFAKKTLAHLANQKQEKSAENEADKAKTLAINAFREKLEETIYFLGSSFVLRPETEKLINEVLDEKIGKLEKEFGAKLRAFSENVSENATRETLAQIKKGGKNVSDMD